ncbi:MAG: transporter substrate-binding domain-containing protein [Lachnospiraceae bacterium]|jgi:signal transduction histidine kinase/membrane-bound lytic murein transglycosylase MltF|nr:transporter substrate-binding domain-containing protein [Lachnospiraceae bacterium]
MPVMRAGLYSSFHYSYQNSDGTYAGADVEYFYKIAQTAGEEVSVRLYDNETDMLEDLDDGTLDMLFDFGKTPEREEKYLFSDNQIGATSLSIYVRKSDERFDYGNIPQLDGLTIGYDEGNSDGRIYEEWCAEQGIRSDMKAYHSRYEINKALDSRQIDAALVGQDGYDGYSTILNFAPQPYYILFRKDETKMKNTVDTAMNRILINDPLYESKLLEKYNVLSSGTQGFSATEKEYMLQHPDLRVAVVNGDNPYYSRTDGKDTGIIPDYYEKIAAYTGLSVTFSAYDLNKDAINAVKNGDADVLAMFSDGVITASNDGLMLTDAYENVDSAMLTRVGTAPTDIHSIAVKERSVNNVKQSIADSLRAKVVPVSNARAGFEALRSGKVDAVVCGLPTATWILNQTNSAAYTSVVQPSLKFDLCAATASGNTRLASILDKAISATNYSFEGFVESNTVQEKNWRTAIARISPVWIVLFTLLLTTVIVILALALITMARGQKEKAALAAARIENEKKQLQLEAIEKSTEARNQFFSNISHDMRTPLNAINGFIHLAQNKAATQEQVDAYLEKAESSSRLLLDLIDDTLTVSKASSGKMQLHPEPVNTKELFESISVPIREAAEKKGVTFTVLDEGLQNRTIMADRLCLQKIFLNLLSNAVKYTPTGGHVRMHIYNEASADGGTPDSLLDVEDDGIGMSPEFLQHAFEPFTQEKRHGYESVGTGLGLSIVKQLVEIMGGTISARSTKDAGTTFTVRLHFEEAPSSGSPAADPAMEPSEENRFEAAGMKVLLCEDNELNREVALALLGEKGITADTAENGQIGAEKFSQSVPGEYSAILMDIRMPVMDGLEATKNIRAMKRADAGTIPIIAMTADAFPEDVLRCMEAGMNGHIAKPIDPEKLYKELKDCAVPGDKGTC